MNDFDRYSLDLYGFGKTPLGDVRTVDDYADGIARWADKTGIDRAVFVAHSFGGRVAISLAARYPGKVAGLVLISSAGVKPRRKPSYYLRVAQYRLRRLFGADTSSCGSADYRAAQGGLREVMCRAVRFFQEGQLCKISVPVLIIYGKSDKETPPSTARKIRRNVRDGALIAMRGGHFCYLENAQTVSEIIRAFAGGVK